MAIAFRTGQYVDPSGFPLAVVNVPALDPNTNISLTDNSYTWEENVTSQDSGTITSNTYISTAGVLPTVSTPGFLVTNQSIQLSSSPSLTPLYYQHICRFYHYTYGNNPIAQVQITDENGVVLPSLAYTVQVSRIQKYVYQVNVLTAFRNPSGSSYMVQYNRCSSNGSNIYPSWREKLSVTPLFISGVPTSYVDQYLLLGPSATGTYTPIVPPVPTLGPLTNILGVSIANSPTIITNNIANNSVDYYPGVNVTYTITAVTNNTFTIQRDHSPVNGQPVTNSYLSSATSNTWGSAATFNTGTPITGIPGITVKVHTDNPLIPNDQACFTASTSLYYIDITDYEAIYLIKPTNKLPDDDWYMNVANGVFRRTMSTSGNEVPSGYGTTWQYAIPEYETQVFASGWGQPYIQAINERPTLQDSYNFVLENTPLFINPSSVFANPLNPGFPPYEFISVKVNGDVLSETSVTNWDIDNGIITVGQTLSNTDDINVTYLYEQNKYVYEGFLGSGMPYPTVAPFPYEELNLNPTPGLGYGIYASGLIATIFAKPNYNVTVGATVNNPVLYHNFTGIPLTEQITDPSTWYMDHFQGTNGATAHTADSGQVLTFHGGASITSAQTAMGGTSVVFNGTNAYLTAPYNPSAPLQFLSNSFTIEFRFMFNSLTGAQELVGQYVDGNNFWYCYKNSPLSGNKLEFYMIHGGTVVCNCVMTSSWSTVTTGTWYTLMFGANNGTVIISINGVPQALTNTVQWGTNTFPAIASTLNIGFVTGWYSNGWMDELIINTEYCYYPSTYTPSITEYRYGQVDFNLGSVSLGPNCNITDVQITDVRTRGGGLSSDGQDNLPQVEVLQPESQFFWDVGYFDGQAVPADGVIVVKVPSSVLSTLTKDEVKARVYKHVALGTYCIIQYQ